MRTDYKFWYIIRNDDGFITEAVIRFYEGDYQTKVIDGEEKMVYVRSKRLNQSKDFDLNHLAKEVDGKLVVPIIKEVNGKETVHYSPADFGQIKTDEELVAFLNTEISKDKGREVVDEQKI